jgi:hypothetical protein
MAAKGVGDFSVAMGARRVTHELDVESGVFPERLGPRWVFESAR